jgi:1-acyl-sn-glycerol-3-phosphate acyltransferase
VFYDLVRWTSIPLFALYFRLERRGLEQVPGSGPVIVAANHVSFLDPAVLGSAFPRRLRFLIDRTTWSYPSLNWFYRGMAAIPVPRDGGLTRDAIRAALGALAGGAAIGIFPEGGRREGLDPEAAYLGVALLARHSRAPVVPAGLAGTDRAMPRGVVLPEPCRVRVTFGKALRHADVAAGLSGRAADERFTRTLMEVIGRLARADAEDGS